MNISTNEDAAQKSEVGGTAHDTHAIYGRFIVRAIAGMTALLVILLGASAIHRVEKDKAALAARDVSNIRSDFYYVNRVSYADVDNIAIATKSSGLLPHGFSAKIAGQKAVIKNPHGGQLVFFGSDSTTPATAPGEKDKAEYLHMNYSAKFMTSSVCATMAERLSFNYGQHVEFYSHHVDKRVNLSPRQHIVYIDGVEVKNTMDNVRINDIWNTDLAAEACAGSLWREKVITLISS